MIKYIFRQILGLFATLLLVSIIIFVCFTIIPGNPAELLAGVNASEEQIEIIREQLGLNQNLIYRYINWLAGALTGNFGESIQYGVPVKALLGDRIVVTSSLAIMTLIITIVISFPLGLISALYQRRIADKIISTSVSIGMAMPNYLLGIVFIWICGLILHVFVPGQYCSYSDDLLLFIKGLIFPALAIAIPKICLMIKYIRNSIVEQYNAEYVKTARCNGGDKKYIILHHIMRNALIPMATLFGMVITDTMAGSIVVEQEVGVPGVGRLLISAINNRDFPVVMTLVVYISLIVICINFIVELLIKINDPRMRKKIE